LTPRTAIGGILIPSIEGWGFCMQDNVIAGQRMGDVGFLRIATMDPNRFSQPVNHAQCMELAMHYADVAHERPEVWQRSHSATGVYGSATFHRGKDWMRVWYCYRPMGLILAVYAVPEEMAEGGAHRIVMHECNEMMRGVIFNRASWGASDDPIGKWLTEQMEAERRGGVEPTVPPLPEPDPEDFEEEDDEVIDEKL